MKVTIGNYSIDFNEEKIKVTKKAIYINSRVKALEWTGIDRDTLTEKVSEVYDIVRESGK